ncbi:relaxase/mobilization nuclease domain-containing protein [Chryseobacterium sp. SL1]|uniref:relaxase/mobilization nuclease domain-containing protein n=1 Tax=Chryseobacterium sp. SL1 TaxID=2995159 RepID=UPI0022754147|nr:relaxase/mobilization nuclease domain-containing protein [Chryseobacterium sp. SL1]MCY1659328.1 relaxase/mobilization nuclease domain-containing protein [Chryseobacterium sp. SL1]MCY1659334.1 relaxase/mobilization nuclease domain-containing protein [Chryseobacterium sp. SL1]
MVSKAKSIIANPKRIQYIQSDKSLGDALEIDRNGIISSDPNEIFNELRIMQEANEKCKKNTISIVISPSSEREFTRTELREITREHLKGLGLDQNQYLATVHRSTGHTHIHVIANRINECGKAVSDSFISKRSQDISEKIAKEKGLLTAKDWKKINEVTISPVKEEIKKAHDFSKLKAQDFSEYSGLMKSRGIEVIPTINKQGKMQGFKFYHQQSDMTFKASDIGKNAGVKDLLQNRVKIPNLSAPYLEVQQEMQREVRPSINKQFSR